jgi:hypothetical protein
MMGRCSLFVPNMVGIFPPLLWFLGYSKPEIPLRFLPSSAYRRGITSASFKNHTFWVLKNPPLEVNQKK